MEELGARAGLSRAAFARRFAMVVGQPPLAYLTWWRMTIAGRLLATTDLPLRLVARRGGYASEFAFAKAFKREYGMSPGMSSLGASTYWNKAFRSDRVNTVTEKKGHTPMSTPIVTGWAVLDYSHQALRAAVQGVPAGGWELPTPCAQWNVTQVLQHAAGDQIGFASFLTGEPGPADNPFAPSGTLAEEPAAYLEAALERSAKAWAGVDRAAAEVPVPVPPNKLTPEVGAGACALDAAVHAWDIAMATGQPTTLTREYAVELLAVARQIVEPLRAYGAYAAALEPRDGDDEVAELLRYLGRDPEWSAA
ncbi:TIGR03086 family metal-binding protein [Nonomuraea muscovyensis]|uniref:TIGR03086 family metal-binding protein n=1 Tax=Nonomuraea muscovyensis TaxID=1124761 RepID=UPI0035E41E09